MTTDVAISSVISKGELEFNILKETIEQAAKECHSLKVTDDLSLQLATQKLSVVADLSSQVDKIHKKLKDPFWQVCKQFDALKNNLKEIIDPAIQVSKNEIKAYNDALEKKKAEEKAKLEEERIRKENERIADEKRKLHIQNVIKEIGEQLNTKIAACNTPADCSALAISITEKFPELHTFQEFENVATECKMNALKSLAERKKYLDENALLNEEQAKLAKEKERLRLEQEELDRKNRELESERIRIEEAKKAEEKARFEEEERIRKEQELELTKAKNMRSTWNYEVVDFSKVPDAFKELNTKAVNEFKNKNKAVLVNGVIIDGIRYFIDSSVVAK